VEFRKSILVIIRSNSTGLIVLFKKRTKNISSARLLRMDLCPRTVTQVALALQLIGGTLRPVDDPYYHYSKRSFAKQNKRFLLLFLEKEEYSGTLSLKKNQKH
jgi:hypothetical protein